MNFEDAIKIILNQYKDVLSPFLKDIKEYFYDDYLTSNDMGYKNYIQTEICVKCVEYINYVILGFCGCGHPELTNLLIKNYLKILEEYTDSKDKDSVIIKNKAISDLFLVDNYLNVENSETLIGLIQIMQYLLDDKGFTEHGSSISGAWITDLGRAYLYCLQKWELDYYEIYDN